MSEPVGREWRFYIDDMRPWAHEVSRRPPRARAMRVASGVAGSEMRGKMLRNLLMFNRFSAMHAQYDIVLMYGFTTPAQSKPAHPQSSLGRT